MFENVDLCSYDAVSTLFPGSLCSTLFEFRGTGMQFFPEYNWLLADFFVYVMPVLYLVGSIGLFFVVEGFDVRVSKRVLRLAMLWYNLAQVIACTYMFTGLTPFLTPFTNPFSFNISPQPLIEWYILIHYLSKYLDYFDTIWMILNRKSYAQLSVLHLWHHSTIGEIWLWMLKDGVALTGNFLGSEFNNLIHICLFAHYGITSLGYNNPLKKWLTRFQMIQFAFCLTHAWVFVIFKDPIWKYALMQVFYQASMLYLFGFHMKWMPWFVNKYAKKPVLEKKE